jgi:hypothetical protein
MLLRERILETLATTTGLTDSDLAALLMAPGAGIQRINSECRRLAASGALIRSRRPDGRLGNFVSSAPADPTDCLTLATDPLSEAEMKRALVTWLRATGWTVDGVAWAKSHGVDIDASRNGERLLIEVKGRGSRPEMRVNYFLGALGELLQRMDDPSAEYAVGLPELPQFRGLWMRLPDLAKRRLKLIALFVNELGEVAVAGPGPHVASEYDTV